MSHKTVFMGIPAKKFGNDFSKENVTQIVAQVMAKYLEETAKEDNIKCDWYEIGGRWAGTFGALKGASRVLPAESGAFAYELFDTYNVLVNNGQQGQYIIDGVEYIPVDGGEKKDIAWEAIAKFDQYNKWKLLNLIVVKDPRLGESIPDMYQIKEDGLYASDGENTVLLLKTNESFEEWLERNDISFDSSYSGMPADAYIDKNGVWHDDNDVWALLEKKMLSGKATDMPENPFEAAQEQFLESFDRFLTEDLQPDDYVVVLDCHSFP